MFDKDVGKLKLALEKLNRDLPATTLQRHVVEQRSVPQVKALYSYSKHGIDVVKGELMFLVVKVCHSVQFYKLFCSPNTKLFVLLLS